MVHLRWVSRSWMYADRDGMMTTVRARISATGLHVGSAALMLLGSTITTFAHAADATTIRDLKRMNVEDLLNIEVTSVTRKPEKLLGAASAIQVITAADIRHSGANTLPEALRLASNLQVAQRGAHGWAVSARGFNADLANKLLVMIDGRTVYSPLFSGVFWEAQDYLLEDIDRIEVISGPGGTLWGANAVNGVINIITKSAASTAGLHVEGAAGMELNHVAGLRYGGNLGADTPFRVYAKHLDVDDTALADGSRTGDGWHKTQGGFRVDSATSSSNEQILQGDIYELDVKVPAGGTTTMRGANLLGRWTQRVSEDSDWSLQTYYDWTEIADAVPALVVNGLPFAPAGLLRDNLRTLDVDFQHRLSLGTTQTMVWGLGFRNSLDVVSNAPALGFLPARLTHQLYSAFLQDEFHLGNGLSITAGTKLEHNDYTGLEIEPSLRAQWQPAEDTTVWAAVSRAVRTPSRIDRDMRQPTPPYPGLINGNTQFDSETLIAWEAGYRARNTSAISTSASVFYNVYNNIRSISITPNTILPFFISNNVAGHAYGAELTGSLQLIDNWSLHAGYNFLQTRLHVKEGQFDLAEARNETADPKHQLSLRTSIDLSERLELDAGLRWVDRLPNNDAQTPGSVPSYVDLNMRIAWHFSNQLELSVAGQNLLHRQHPEYGFPRPDRAEIERSVYGKLVWRH